MHPANQEQKKVFQSDDLQECLEYAKDTEDLEPLQFAIELQKKNSMIAKKIIELCQDATGYNVYIKHQLQKIKNYL